VKIYICDTNNHCIRMCYYDVGQVQTLQFTGVPPTQHEFLDPKAELQSSPLKKPGKDDMNELNLVCEGGLCRLAD